MLGELPIQIWRQSAAACVAISACQQPLPVIHRCIAPPFFADIFVGSLDVVVVVLGSILHSTALAITDAFVPHPSLKLSQAQFTLKRPVCQQLLVHTPPTEAYSLFKLACIHSRLKILQF